MPGLEHGLERAFEEFIGGLVIAILLNIIPIIIEFPFVISMINLLNLFFAISFILAIPYWGTGYLIGWLIGISLLIKFNLLEVSDIILYFIIPLLILILRFCKEKDYI